MSTTTETPTAYGTITNRCTCTTYDEVLEEYTDEPSADCLGDCWSDTLHFFGECVKEFMSDSEKFCIENLRLWDGEHSGVFHANNVAELIRGMTVNSEWSMDYKVFPNRIEYSLSHHDAPTGSCSVVRPLAKDEQ